jgi:4-aminobutyrate aminotransferase-like enzyme
MGAKLADGLRELADRHRCVGDVRTIGLYGALELVADRETRQPIPDDLEIPVRGETTGAAAKVAARLRDEGILVNAMRVQGIVKMSPPLTVTRDEVDLVVEHLDAALGEVDSAVQGAGG